jgi:hypothetical protein
MNGEKSVMVKMLWGLLYALALVCFISFLLWLFTDELKYKIIFLISFALQIYGILTKENVKKS